MIHREGRMILLMASVIMLTLTFVAYFTFTPFIFSVLILLFIIILLFLLNFFRNPKRGRPTHLNMVVAPVDGKVVVKESVYEEHFLKKKCIQISIFMSPLNVHVCRYPVSGKVLDTVYHPGKYLVAWHPKSSEKNERTSIVVQSIGGPILFRQVAGALARRIVLYTKKGDLARAGEEFGFIKFGSRVDVFLPLNAEIKVKLNEKTIGGETVIAQLNREFF